MQHDLAEPDALGEAGAGQMQRPAAGDVGAGPGERLQLARGDHLGEHHRRGQQRLDLLLGIDAVRPVLHDEHAERLAGAQHRHAEEGVVDLLAGLGPVGEGRVVLGVGRGERLGLRGDQADEALAHPHGRQVDGVRVQALGGEELERAVVAQHVERADLGDHVGGDQDDDLVEAVLRRHRLRHDFAQPAQQHARTADRATHHVPPCAALTHRASVSRRILGARPCREIQALSSPYSECSVRTASSV